ncbi:MAG: universal stress protein [Balneolaceae bacterium]|nr:universal stress protein [Balneolaceae bacterium]
MKEPIRNIYFPTDFSQASEKALPYAAEIARRTGATLTIVHVSEEPIDLAPSSRDKKQEVTAQARERFQKLKDRLMVDETYRDLEITTSLLSGNPVVNLLDMVRERKPDLLVMGTQGAGNAHRALMGSMASGIISQSPVPVMVIPPESQFNDFQNIHFATDYKEGDLKALRWTADFSKLFKAKLGVVHIAEEKSFRNEMDYRGFRSLAAEATGKPKLPMHLAYNGDFHEGINTFMNEHDTSLLIMTRYKKSFFDALLSAARTREMGLFGQRPLLVLVGPETD